MNPHSSSANPLSRRQFLATSVAATATLCLGGALLPSAARAATKNLRRVSLNGEWQVSMGETDVWIPAQVPGCIHTDLLAAGKIADPFYRDNEKAVQWVGETDWLYRRSFDVDAEMLSHKQVILRCEGLDTLATIRINGHELGKTDNMFRTWEFDAKRLLKSGDNKIEILISSPAKFVDALEKKRGENKGVTGRAWLRKQPCQFGWDWAPTLITSGIWRSISLEALDQARFDDVLILQDHSVKNRVGLTIKASAQNIGGKPLRAKFTVTQDGVKIGGKKIQTCRRQR
jgi:beta-mannosidase